MYFKKKSISAGDPIVWVITILNDMSFLITTIGQMQTTWWQNKNKNNFILKDKNLVLVSAPLNQIL